jgi:hypothetical protein
VEEFYPTDCPEKNFGNLEPLLIEDFLEALIKEFSAPAFAEQHQVINFHRVKYSRA